MKKVLRTLSLFILAALVASYATLTYRNNQSVPTPDRTRIQAAYGAAVAWVSERETALLDQSNPALWWMVQKSAALTGDATLTALFERYRLKHLQGGRNIWEPPVFSEPVGAVQIGRYCPLRRLPAAFHVRNQL